jgi:hypothetical protein
MNLLPTLPTLGFLQTTTDNLGNIFDASGNHVGVTPNSAADIGSKGFQLPALKGDTSWIDNPTGMQGLPTPIAPARPTSNSTTPTKTDDSGISWHDIAGGAIGQVTGVNGAGISDALKHPSQILPNIADKATSFIFTSRLIFLVIGLLLLGAGLFQFKTTQTVIEMGTKAAKLAAA